MLVLKKEVKLGLGVGAAVAGIALVYGLMAVLSANSRTPGQQANTDDQSSQIATDTTKDDSNTKSPAMVSGLPPKDDAKPAGDPFAESTRTDGNKNDPWEQALKTGTFQQSAAAVTPTDTKSSGLTQLGSTSSGGSTAGDANGPIVTKLPTMPAPIDVTTTGGNSGIKSAEVATDKPAQTDSAIAGSSYKVQPGDTFSKIAGKLYGDKRLASAIMKANPNIEPTRLRAGETISVPAKEEVATIRGSITPAPAKTTGAIDANHEYRVQSGDTLSRIAVKLYGRRGMWEALYDANKSTIGADPAKLKVGEVLKLPKEPSKVS